MIGDPPLNAKLRQVARIAADGLKRLPDDERADWLTTEYPGGFDAGKAVLVHALHDSAMAPSRTLHDICEGMFGISLKPKRKDEGKEEEP